MSSLQRSATESRRSFRLILACDSAFLGGARQESRSNGPRKGFGSGYFFSIGGFSCAFSAWSVEMPVISTQKWNKMPGMPLRFVGESPKKFWDEGNPCSYIPTYMHAVCCDENRKRRVWSPVIFWTVSKRHVNLCMEQVRW